MFLYGLILTLMGNCTCTKELLNLTIGSCATIVQSDIKVLITRIDN